MTDRFVQTGAVYIGNDEYEGQYEVTVDSWEAEPYSWGEGRGRETGASARMLSFTMDGATLTRDDAVRLTGVAHVERQERLLAEDVLEGEMA